MASPFQGTHHRQMPCLSVSIAQLEAQRKGDAEPGIWGLAPCEGIEVSPPLPDDAIAALAIIFGLEPLLRP